jgi:hypothetical protein
MYRPKQGREREQNVRRPEPRKYPGFVVPVLTAVFWAPALVFVALMALYAFTKSVGTASSWATGISLLLVTLSSGAITWVELRTNPLDDTGRGEWTNKMLFYGLICVISFIIACLYLPAFYFAP